MLKRGLFNKFFGLITLVMIIVSTIIIIFLLKEQTQRIEEALVQENKLLIKTAASIIETAYREGFFPFKILKEISDSENILFLWLVKPTGEIYFADDPEMIGKKIDDPFLSREELMIRDSIYPQGGKKIKLITYPVKREIGEKPWSLFLGVSLDQVAAAKRKIIFTSLSFFLGVLIFGAFVSFYLTKGIIRPLEELRKGVEIIGKGNLDYRIKLKTGDEIEELAESFNQMAKSLGESHAALEEAKTVLEIKVQARTKELRELVEQREEIIKERTKELRKKIEELEKFQRLAVGRELKMIELKEEIKKLKEELKGRK
ncbi:MAG: HAMP domain-containing protein [Patescibacteria group bacterium]|nr:HAMP domain-containing protein [Patescibacteria group bacterium]